MLDDERRAVAFGVADVLEVGVLLAQLLRLADQEAAYQAVDLLDLDNLACHFVTDRDFGIVHVGRRLDIHVDASFRDDFSPPSMVGEDWNECKTPIA
ncbi:hypothetical protein D3C87_1967930 [compost metagenome]